MKINIDNLVGLVMDITKPAQPSQAKPSPKIEAIIKQIRVQEAKGFVDKEFFSYRDNNGKEVYIRVRMKNHATGEKWIRPFHLSNGKYISGEPTFNLNGKPLYRQEKWFSLDCPVWVVEGEQKVEALEKLGLHATTSGSAMSAKHADWTPLRGRIVIIWPDNDEPGEKYCAEVESILTSYGCKVSVIDVSRLGLAQSEDVIDWLKRNPGAEAPDINNLPRKPAEVPTGGSLCSTVPYESSVAEAWEPPRTDLTTSNPARPYPLQALPQEIRKAVEEAVKYVQCPVALAANSAIASISIAAQGLANVERDLSLVGPISLNILSIAESGERKSTIDKLFCSEILAWDEAQILKGKQSQSAYKASLAAWKKTEASIQNKLGEALKTGKGLDTETEALQQHLESEPAEPKIKSLLFTDVTQEELGYSLSTHYPIRGIHSSEGGIVLGGIGMRKDSAMRFLNLLNILWDGGTHRVDRRTSAGYIVKNARLSVNLSLQLAALNEFIKNTGEIAVGTGFLARFLVAWPESTQGLRAYKSCSSEMPQLEIFNEKIRRVLNRLEAGITLDKTIKLSPEAKSEWIKFHDRIEAGLLPGGLYSTVRDFASKSADNVARMAALFKIFEDGQISGDINARMILSASEIVEWHLHEAIRLMDSLNRLSQPAPHLALMEWLIVYCQRNSTGRIEKSKLLQNGPLHLRRKAELDSVIECLVDKNCVRIKLHEAKRFIEVNPHLLKP